MTTGLDQAIVDWWRDTSSLNSLVHLDLVAAELRQADETIEQDDDENREPDDCVMFQIASEPHYRTNSGQGWKSVVKVSCLSVDYDRSKTIAQAVAVAWNNTPFTGTGSTITLSRFTGIVPAQDDETGIWDHTVSFIMNHTGI